MISKPLLRRHIFLILLACSSYVFFQNKQDDKCWNLNGAFVLLSIFGLLTYLIDSSHASGNGVVYTNTHRGATLLAIGANPAHQVCLVFEKFRGDQVNRAKSEQCLVGGKGQNCAKGACNIVPGCCMVAQFLGGQTGEQIQKSLEDKNVPQLTIKTMNATRVCTTLKSESDGTVTEIVGPSGEILDSERHSFLVQVKKSVQNMKGVAICGSFPPGFQGKDYAEIALSLPSDCFLLLDSVKEPELTLKSGRVSLWKINEDELRKFFNDFESPIDRLASVAIEKFNLTYLGLTRGGQPAMLYENVDEPRKRVFRLPKIKITNSTGAGDTFNGAFLVTHILKGESIQTSFRLGLAAASAKCQNMKGGGTFDVQLMNEIAPLIEVSSHDFFYND